MTTKRRTRQLYALAMVQIMLAIRNEPRLLAMQFFQTYSITRSTSMESSREMLTSLCLIKFLIDLSVDSKHLKNFVWS